MDRIIKNNTIDLAPNRNNFVLDVCLLSADNRILSDMISYIRNVKGSD